MNSVMTVKRSDLAWNVLLSIHPEQAEAILGGDKPIEYRRVYPAYGPPLRLVLYATAPVQAAVGTAWTSRIYRGDPWYVVERTIDRTCDDREDVLAYFGDREDVGALELDCYRRFEEPVPRRSLEAADLAPSQNFRYLNTVPWDPEGVEHDVVVPGNKSPIRTDGGVNPIAERIVDLCEHDPADNVDPHPKLFSDLDDGRVPQALFDLWQKGIVDAEWDDEDGATYWWLTHFGVELVERQLLRQYVEALEDEIRIEAPLSSLLHPDFDLLEAGRDV